LVVVAQVPVTKKDSFDGADAVMKELRASLTGSGD
jgi:hypothetical protein